MDSDAFWNRICGSPLIGYDIAVGSAIVVAFFLITFPFLEPGTASYVVSALSGAVALVTLTITGGIYWKCSSLE